MGEHDFVREEGNPFKRGGAVSRGATNELVLAMVLANQPGGAKPANNPAGETLGKQLCQFHSPQLSGGPWT